MFCIVYIQSVRRNYVVPIEWIRGLDSHMVKFLNYGVSGNQTYRVFWTTDPNAFKRNEIPKNDYPPNVFASNDAIFPHEGWYKCNITKFKGNSY